MNGLSRIVTGTATLFITLSVVACGSRSEPTSPNRAPPRPVSPIPTPATPPTTPAASAPEYPSVIVAQFDLQQLGNQSLPVTEEGGGGIWQITGGHYYLGADNTYAFGYDINGVNRPAPIGKYVWVDATTVKFYLAPDSYPASSFYRERDGLFSTGKIEGGTMTVTYEDWLDFELEKYTLSH